MKKFGMVLGAAAIAAIAGCKDPNYRRGTATAGQNEAKNADTTVAQPEKRQPVGSEKKCKCAPGTRHTAPCACGGSSCYCIVEQKVETRPAQPPSVQPKADAKASAAVEPETTIYVVQSGDYLAKISKKFNVTIAAIKQANGLKGDIVRVGQKLKIPGKFDLAAKASESAKAAAPAATKKAASQAAPYTGATKEYVVKSGDTLGAIAYGNGIRIRQLKELNGLKSDVVRVGQKLKIPAEKQAKAAAAKKTEKQAEKPVVKAPAKAADAAVEKAKTPTEEVKTAEVSPAEEPKAADASPVEEPKTNDDGQAAAAPAPATTTYVVQEGDDMTGVSIRFGVSAADIRELNNFDDAYQLKPGQAIKLPAEVQQ